MTTDEIKECCKDLKILGKKEFKSLIKWRESIRLDLGYTKSEEQKSTETKQVEEEQEETPESLAEKVNSNSNSYSHWYSWNKNPNEFKLI